MRTELTDAVSRAWQALGACGVWWTAEQRVTIVREARAARGCTLCRERKAALVPQAVAGTHAVATALGVYAAPNS